MNFNIKIEGGNQLNMYFDKLEKGIKNDVKNSLNKIGSHLQKSAKSKLGQYYASWPKLKRASVIAKYRKRALKGHSTGKRKTARFRIGPDNPLVLFGELKKSIMKEVNRAGMEVTVYSDNEYSAVHEYGYKQVPSRSYMRTTLEDESDNLIDIVDDYIKKNI